MDITITIPNNQTTRLVTALNALYPKPIVDGKPLYTNRQWAKELIRQWLISQVQIHEEGVARGAASVAPDEQIVGND